VLFFLDEKMQRFEQIMRGIQGALIIASFLHILVGFSGLWRNVTRLEIHTCSEFPLFLDDGVFRSKL